MEKLTSYALGFLFSKIGRWIKVLRSNEVGLPVTSKPSGLFIFRFLRFLNTEIIGSEIGATLYVSSIFLAIDSGFYLSVYKLSPLLHICGMFQKFLKRKCCLHCLHSNFLSSIYDIARSF